MGLFNVFSNYIPMSAMDTDGTLTANSDDKLSTQKAVKTYVGNPSNFLKVYKNGALNTAPKFYYSSAVVASGTVTFYLTDDGTAGGNALFTNVDQESFSWWVNDATNQFQLGSYSLAGNKKSITLTVNRIGLSLGVIIFTSAANGVNVNLAVWGS